MFFLGTKIVLTLACAVFVCACLYFQYSNADARGLLAKVSASLCFVALGLTGYLFDSTEPALRSGSSFLLGGLSLAALGDALLGDPKKRGFALGLCCFLAAQGAYVLSFWQELGSDQWLHWQVAPFALGALLLVVILGARVGKLLLPLGLYLLALLLMVSGSLALSRSGHGWLFAVSGGLFFVSDLCVSLRRFGPPRFAKHQLLLRALGLPTYYLAQLGFAWLV